MAKVMSVGEQTVTLGIWVSAGARAGPAPRRRPRPPPRASGPCHPRCRPQDTAGSERYEAMSRIYYRGARAAVVCYGEGTENGKGKEPAAATVPGRGGGGGSAGSGSEER